MKSQLSRPGGVEFTREMIRRVTRSGMVAVWPMSTAPSGWIKLDGANVSRLQYDAIFAVIGTTYGVGDGSTTFGLPSWAAPAGGIYIMKV